MATRAGSYPRQQAQRQRRAFWRKSWWRVALISLMFVVMGAVIGWLWPDWAVPGWALPVIVWVLAFGAAQSSFDGTYHLEMGELAEKWTSQELKKLSRAGGRHFDHVLFDRFDVDHVLVYPSGVFAIETKYTDREVDLEGSSTRPLLNDWRDCALKQTDKIRSFLKTSKRFVVDITPIVVVWGPRIEGTSKVVDGVLIVRGRALADTIERLGTMPKLDLAKQTAIEEALEAFIEARDSYLAR